MNLGQATSSRTLACISSGLGRTTLSLSHVQLMWTHVGLSTFHTEHNHIQRFNASTVCGKKKPGAGSSWYVSLTSIVVHFQRKYGSKPSYARVSPDRATHSISSSFRHDILRYHILSTQSSLKGAFKVWPAKFLSGRGSTVAHTSDQVTWKALAWSSGPASARMRRDVLFWKQHSKRCWRNITSTNHFLWISCIDM